VDHPGHPNSPCWGLVQVRAAERVCPPKAISDGVHVDRPLHTVRCLPLPLRVFRLRAIRGLSVAIWRCLEAMDR
jgi:hypothetical protein